MPATLPNDKPARRYRRERNLVAKNNRHKGGVHTERKQPKPMGLRGSMTQDEIYDWWEVNA
jgi:hypothetical protein